MTTWGALLADPEAPTPDELLARADAEILADSVNAAMDSHLDPRSRDILRARYGDQPESWKSLAQRLGVPKRRLQAIESRALNVCRLAVARSTPAEPLSHCTVEGEQLLMF